MTDTVATSRAWPWEALSRPTLVYALTSAIPMIFVALVDSIRKGWTRQRIYALASALINTAVWSIAIELLSRSAHTNVAWTLALLVPTAILVAVLAKIVFNADIFGDQ
jgi:hypothetical protein